MDDRKVFQDNFNAYSLQWNVHYGERRDAMGLEMFIETHDLICNNEPGKVTRLTRGQTTSIIDLIFTTPSELR